MLGCNRIKIKFNKVVLSWHIQRPIPLPAILTCVSFLSREWPAKVFFLRLWSLCPVAEAGLGRAWSCGQDDEGGGRNYYWPTKAPLVRAKGRPFLASSSPWTVNTLDNNTERVSRADHRAAWHLLTPKEKWAASGESTTSQEHTNHRCPVKTSHQHQPWSFSALALYTCL